MFGLGKPTFSIKKHTYDEMLVHAAEAYPNECCGVLVGSHYKGKKAFGSYRAENINKERSKDRYMIEPRELHLIDKMARAEGMDIMGFYHSHPDHPDKPSETDRELAHAGYSYVIISVQKGVCASSKCWAFEEDNEPFHEEKLKID